MANTLRNTAGALFPAGPLNIQKVKWVGPTTIGNKYNIDGDIAGISIDAGTCDTSNRDVNTDFVPAQACRDFKVTALDSGKLLIFVE